MRLESLVLRADQCCLMSVLHTAEICVLFHFNCSTGKMINMQVGPRA